MMELYSLSYFLLIFLVFVTYWLLPERYRPLVLLGASLFLYYVFEKRYVLVLLSIGSLSFVMIRLIRKKRSLPLLLFSIGIILLPLFILKYFGVLFASLQALLSLNDLSLKLLAPIGISYYTFEAISCLADAYRQDDYEPAGLIDHLCYLTYFPTVMSGPIERSTAFIGQLKKKQRLDSEKALSATRLLIIGLFKKIVIADHLAVCANAVYNNVTASSGFALLIAELCYTFQIYCDFSGYSAIASGLSGLFGIEINSNFARPYLAASIKEFWSRWHISLSQWLRDYIYIPLGGNRKGKARKYLNLLITFLVSAAWHGPKLVNIVWGLFHAVMEIFEDLLHVKKPSGGREKVLRIIWTFLLINISWVIFRADSVADLLYMLDPRNVLNGLDNLGLLAYFHQGFTTTGFNIWLLALMLIVILTDLAYESGRLVPGSCSRGLAYAMYLVMILLIMAFASTEGVSFVYFKY